MPMVPCGGSATATAAGWRVTPGQLAIAWLRHCPAVTCPIVGISSLAQFEEAVRAFDCNLTDDQAARLAGFFDTEVKEEAGGNFKPLRRELRLVN